MRRAQGTANDFLNASRSLPTWIASVSFLACNCGALEILGLSGIAARYGVQAFQFYWIGAIPALIFVSVIILPNYIQSGVTSVPDYLGKRFGSGIRLLNSSATLISTALYGGISLYGLAEVMHVAAQWPFVLGVFTFSPIVLIYVAIGGVRATVYNEVLQFLFTLAGLAPLLYLTRDLRVRATLPTEYWHLWRATPLFSSARQVDCVGVVVGLGLVISFSYWCTDFALMQRALTARTLESARRVPLIAGFGKLLVSFMVVFPVLAMEAHMDAHSWFSTGPLDETAPSLISTLFSPNLVWVGIAALMAGLLNTLASNVSAFTSIWTEEIYRPFLRPRCSESHYIIIGRIASIACIFLSIGGSFATQRFESLSEFVLLLFSLFVVPFFAVILTGVTSQRGTSRSACWGASAGIITGAIVHLAYEEGWLRLGSQLNASFYGAIASFSVAFALCNLSAMGRPEHRGSTTDVIPWREIRSSPMLWSLGIALLATCLLLNVLWW